MKRFMAAAALVALTLPLAAQQTGEEAKKIVATLNSETITAQKLDDVYNSLTSQMHDQYERSGGKSAFLDNYIKKRLLIQEAMKQGFDKRPDVQAAIDAARENVIFDRYVRDVVASTVIPESMIRQYYTDHVSEFERPEQVKARHIIITFGGEGSSKKTREEAAAQIKRVFDGLVAKMTHAPAAEAERRAFLIHEFDTAARLYTEDGTAKQGGDLGWFAKGIMDPTFEKVAWETPPGTISAPFESPFGYHIILVEDKRPAGPAPFEDARTAIREQLLATNGAQIMQLVGQMTSQLKLTGKVTLYPENVK